MSAGSSSLTVIVIVASCLLPTISTVEAQQAVDNASGSNVSWQTYQQMVIEDTTEAYASVATIGGYVSVLAGFASFDGGALVGGYGGSADAAVLAVAWSLPCYPGGASSMRSLSSFPTLLPYAISPWYDLGAFFMVGGNLLVVITIGGLQALLILAIRRKDPSATPEAYFRFPSNVNAIASWSVVGTSFGILRLFYSDDVASSSSVSMQIAPRIVMGVFGAMVTCGLFYFQWRTCEKVLRPAVVPLRRNTAGLNQCHALFLPTQTWAPEAPRRQHGSVLMSLQAPLNGWILPLIGLSQSVFCVIGAILLGDNPSATEDGGGSPDGACTAQLVAMSVVQLAMLVLLLIIRNPFRSPLALPFCIFSSMCILIILVCKLVTFLLPHASAATPTLVTLECVVVSIHATLIMLRAVYAISVAAWERTAPNGSQGAAPHSQAVDRAATREASPNGSQQQTKKDASMRRDTILSPLGTLADMFFDLDTQCAGEDDADRERPPRKPQGSGSTSNAGGAVSERSARIAKAREERRALLWDRAVVRDTLSMVVSHNQELSGRVNQELSRNGENDDATNNDGDDCRCFAYRDVHSGEMVSIRIPNRSPHRCGSEHVCTQGHPGYPYSDTYSVHPVHHYAGGHRREAQQPTVERKHSWQSVREERLEFVVAEICQRRKTIVNDELR